MAHGRRDRALWNIQRHDLLSFTTDRIDKLHALEAVVVICLRFDLHLFERRHLPVARRFDDVDVWRTIVDDADEVFGAGVVAETFAIDEEDAIGAVTGQCHRRGELRGRDRRQRHRAAGRERQLSLRDGMFGVNVQSHGSVRRRIDIAAVHFGVRRQAERRGIRVVHVDAGDTGHSGDADAIDRRHQRAGGDAISEIGCHSWNGRAETPFGIRRHLRRSPS